jgi:peptidoglycan/LPS O-acetylase OafA/YrhL
MTWTLGVEEQFYLLLPFLMLLLRRFDARVNVLAILCLTITSLTICLSLVGSAPNAAFYLIPARGWQLCIGVIIAIQTASGKVLSQRTSEVVGTVGLISLIVSTCLFSSETPWPGVAAVLPVAGTAALLLTQGSFVNQVVLSAPCHRYYGQYQKGPAWMQPQAAQPRGR